MPTKQVLFYATVDDLHSGLSRLEEACSIKYVATGLFDENKPLVYATYKNIKGIGISIDGRIESLRTYLLMEKTDDVFVKEVSQRRGGIKYAIDSFTTPSSITFTPSGVYEDKCIIYGTVTGVDVTNDKSKNLYKLFGKYVFKGYDKIKAFKVSPDALKELDSGMRLTPNYQADPIMDLCR